jgi:DNA-binding transcriptional LysR family regulator
MASNEYATIDAENAYLMDCEQLAYFRATARHEHMSRAAEELGISQSALSRSIARLEVRYGVPLFDRLKRGLRLNAFGSALLIRVERALLELENADREIRELAGVMSSQVGLGFFGTLGAKIVPDLIVGFQQQHPVAQFRLLQGGFEVLRGFIRSGDIDLCLTSPRHSDPELDWLPLWEEELVALLPPHHRLIGRSTIELSELASDPVVALRPGNGLRHDLDRLAAEAGFVPRIAFEGTDVAPLLGLVGAGVGVALVPRTFAETQSVAKPLAVGSPHCSRTVGVSWHKGRVLTAMPLAFREYVVAHRPEGAAPLRYGTIAIASTSTRAPSGSAATATVERAGAVPLPKRSA